MKKMIAMDSLILCWFFHWLVVEIMQEKLFSYQGLGCDVEHYSQNQQFYFKMNGLD